MCILSVKLCAKYAVSNGKCHVFSYSDMNVRRNDVYTVGHTEVVGFTVINKRTETVTGP